MTLLQYGHEADPSTKISCEVGTTLATVLAGCNLLEGLPAWVREAKLAAGRLEMSLHSHAKKEWKALVASKGIQQAVKEIEAQKLKLSPDLSKLWDVLKQGQTLQALKEKAEEIDNGNSSVFIQQVKVMLTVSSLDVASILFFFPDMEEAIQQFLSKVTQAVMDGLKKIQQFIKTGVGHMEPYRQGWPE